jgi:hypothetical protein
MINLPIIILFRIKFIHEKLFIASQLIICMNGCMRSRVCETPRACVFVSLYRLMYIIIMLYNWKRNDNKKEQKSSHCSLYRGGTSDREVISSIPLPSFHLHLLKFQFTFQIQATKQNYKNRERARKRETSGIDDENDVAARRGR